MLEYFIHHGRLEQPRTEQLKSRFLSLTGCNGRAVRQQVATPTQWEAAVNRFWQYISDLNVQADGVLQNLKASQLSRELE